MMRYTDTWIGDPEIPVDPTEPGVPVDIAFFEPSISPSGSIFDLFLGIILKLFR